MITFISEKRLSENKIVETMKKKFSKFQNKTKSEAKNIYVWFFHRWKGCKNEWMKTNKPNMQAKKKRLLFLSQKKSRNNEKLKSIEKLKSNKTRKKLIWNVKNVIKLVRNFSNVFVWIWKFWNTREKLKKEEKSMDKSVILFSVAVKVEQRFGEGGGLKDGKKEGWRKDNEKVTMMTREGRVRGDACFFDFIPWCGDGKARKGEQITLEILWLGVLKDEHTRVQSQQLGVCVLQEDGKEGLLPATCCISSSWFNVCVCWAMLWSFEGGGEMRKKDVQQAS